MLLVKVGVLEFCKWLLYAEGKRLKTLIRITGCGTNEGQIENVTKVSETPHLTWVSGRRVLGLLTVVLNVRDLRHKVKVVG